MTPQTVLLDHREVIEFALQDRLDGLRRDIEEAELYRKWDSKWRHDYAEMLLEVRAALRDLRNLPSYNPRTFREIEEGAA